MPSRTPAKAPQSCQWFLGEAGYAVSTEMLWGQALPSLRISTNISSPHLMTEALSENSVSAMKPASRSSPASLFQADGYPGKDLQGTSSCKKQSQACGSLWGCGTSLSPSVSLLHSSVPWSASPRARVPLSAGADCRAHRTLPVAPWSVHRSDSSDL